ncbi:MAG TPA: thiaminase II [Paracoccaceae bacterium]|nr:thiaminase II [Paracoccaceae bacterium]
MTNLPYGGAFGLWRAAAATEWKDYVEHRFVQGLGDGTLPRENFLHYLAQDYVFLINFSRAWALAVVKADTLDEMRACSATVDGLVNYEMELHVRICAGEGISRAQLESTREAIGNLAYTRYVLESGFSGDFLDLLAALAPCVLGYGEIGARLAAEGPAETYRDWVETYDGEEFQKLCRDVGALIDAALLRRLGENFEMTPRWAMLTERFTTATRLEAGFWDMGLAGP